MARLHSWTALLLLGFVAPLHAPAAAMTQAAPAATAIDEEAERRQIDEALALIRDGKPAEAITLLDPLIAAREQAYASEKRIIFTSRSMAEMILYMGMAAQQKRAAIVVSEGWSLAVFLKGFALVDLHRNDEAKAMYDKAVAMAPMNSHYLGELAEWHKNRKDWKAAHDDFAQALAASEFSPDDSKTFDKRRALRGLGFVLIEQGKLDEAEARLREALALDPNDENAKNELQYIEEQRAMARKGAG